MKVTPFCLFACVSVVVEAVTLKVGPGQNFTTIGAANDAAVPGDTIYVLAGTYAEKLIITKKNITLKGASYPSTNPAQNVVSIIASNYASATGGDDSSATVLASGAHFKMYNINVTNNAGNISQAIAISTKGASQGFYACAFIGWQDTLYSHSGSQFYSRCYVEGAVDFIFGTTANAWFQACTLGLDRIAGTITAQGRKSPDTNGTLVFDSARFVAGPKAGPGLQGTVFLGRPWQSYARTVFQYTDEGNFITPAGWEPFSAGQDTSNVQLGEYANKNDAGQRVIGKRLTSPTSISSILPDYQTWVDRGYFGLSAL